MTYKEFIQNIIDTRGQGNIPESEYKEMHHIKPRCLGGPGDTKNNSFYKNSHHENCIGLYPREHFIAHKLLAEENPTIEPLVRAYGNMCTINKTHANTDISPEEYEEARIFVYTHCSGYGANCNHEDHPMYGKDRSGKNNPFYGKTFSDEALAKISKHFKNGKETHPEEFSKNQSRPLGANPRAVAIICVEENKYFECLKLAILGLKENNVHKLDSRKIRSVLDKDELAYNYHGITAEKKNYKKEHKKDHGGGKQNK